MGKRDTATEVKRTSRYHQRFDGAGAGGAKGAASLKQRASFVVVEAGHGSKKGRGREISRQEERERRKQSGQSEEQDCTRQVHGLMG